MSDIALQILLSAQDGASAVIRGLGSSISSLAKGDIAGAAGAAAIAIAAIGVGSVKMAGDFQKSMMTLVTSAGESASNLKMVSDGVLALSTQTGVSTEQLAKGMYMIESSGLHGAAGLDALRAAAM